jgi:hypothetical protein
VDAVMRGVQGASEKTQVDRFCPLSVWMGVAGTLRLGKAVLGKTTGLEGLNHGTSNRVLHPDQLLEACEVASYAAEGTSD